MLATLLKPTSGSGEVAGYDIRQNRDHVRRSIGQSSYPVAFDLGMMVAFSLIMIFLGAFFFEKSESV